MKSPQPSKVYVSPDLKTIEIASLQMICTSDTTDQRSTEQFKRGSNIDMM